MRHILTLLLFTPTLLVHSQSKVGFVVEEMPLDTVLSPAINEHTSVRPLVRSNLKFSLLDTVSKVKKFGIQGISDAGCFAENGFGYRLGGGALMEYSPDSKWYGRLAGVQGITNSSANLLPGAYIVDNYKKNTLYTDIRGRLSYSPNEIFNLQAGLDKNFIGEGNRSLFLSDYGKAYPFGMARTKFWRVEYSLMYQFYKEDIGNRKVNKYGATHYLSLNATKWLNFGLFETVVFMPRDTMLVRGFDAEYLNPIVFFRPQEYSMGSSDNVLLGASFSARIKENTIYGQFILDDFSIAELKAKTKWWANKYGIQLGVKGRATKEGVPVFYRIEYNALRPYTFAHLNSWQIYGNMGHTLTHPLGGNFMEILGELKAQKAKWNAKLCVSYVLQGLDKDGFSYGSNMYRPYTERPYDYGHFIGQGKGNNTLLALLQIGYCLEKRTNLHVFLENRLRYDSAFDKYSFAGMIGIRSQLWNDYRNY
jgi:hypothetical protein